MPFPYHHFMYLECHVKILQQYVWSGSVVTEHKLILIGTVWNLERLNWEVNRRISLTNRLVKRFTCRDKQVGTFAHVPLGWGFPLCNTEPDGSCNNVIDGWMAPMTIDSIPPKANVAPREWPRVDGRQLAFEPGGTTPTFLFFSLSTTPPFAILQTFGALRLKMLVQQNQ